MLMLRRAHDVTDMQIEQILQKMEIEFFRLQVSSALFSIPELLGLEFMGKMFIDK
jgi:hypothetical protein